MIVKKKNLTKKEMDEVQNTPCIYCGKILDKWEIADGEYEYTKTSRESVCVIHKRHLSKRG